MLESFAKPILHNVIKPFEQSMHGELTCIRQQLRTFRALSLMLSMNWTCDRASWPVKIMHTVGLYSKFVIKTVILRSQEHHACGEVNYMLANRCVYILVWVMRIKLSNSDDQVNALEKRSGTITRRLYSISCSNIINYILNQYYHWPLTTDRIRRQGATIAFIKIVLR